MIKKALVTRSQRGQRAASTASVPAPIGGWNARDPEAAMASTDARWMENWFPGTADVTIRKGAEYWQEGLNTPVNSLMAYSSATVQKLFAVNSTGVYDVSVPSDPLGPPVAAVTDSKLCHVLFPVLGVTALIAVNGVDKLLMYNGTTWQHIDSTTTPGITGISTDKFSNVCLFKRRVWFVEKDSLSAWYLPVNLIGGAAVEFPVGQLFPRGGHLVAMASWTVDSGSGADDNLVFITSEGEVAVYSGTDPTSLTDFKLIGTYFLGTPIGKKCFTKYGGDLLVLTQTGLYPLSKALLSSTINRAVALSSKIDLIFSQSATAYGSLFGWSGEIFPTENIAIFNVPTTEGYHSNQLVMNTITNSWALFTGWDAFCWETFNDELYFGGLGYVAKALTGYSDFGNDVTALCSSAFSYFGSRGLTKHFTLFRPILKLNGLVGIDLALDVNFEDSDITSTISAVNPNPARWDVATWDHALWDVEYTARGEWRTVFNKEGFCAALRLRIATKDVRVGWSSTDFVFRKGGIL